MATNPEQIYSATYSNVPVFEFVTPEGPVMRRKSDGWINATHILKIAKFPKAKRTRILEKDVQSGIHEKVQGGYGKYQGTYVPLESGAQIAKLFGVYEILEPIFRFTYIEGTSETPPPAPKHNHASASNVARRQQSIKSQGGHSFNSPDSNQRKKTKLDEQTKKRGRPRRITLEGKDKPELSSSQTVPIANTAGPSMGTFSFKNEPANSQSTSPFLSLRRQDTERDALQMMASNLNLRNDDLESDISADEIVPKAEGNGMSISRDEETDFLSGKELFGAHESYGGRNSFEKIVELHKRRRLSSSSGRSTTVANGGNHYPPGLMQYHHPNTSGEVQAPLTNKNPNDYFTNVLDYFLYDDRSTSLDSSLSKQSIPHEILNPPEPLRNINMNQRVDNDGNSLIHWVCAMANSTLFGLLVSKFGESLDLNIKNCYGETPLTFMIRFNNSFQQHNFDTFLRSFKKVCLEVDSKGQTVLHHIAHNCSPSHQSSSASHPDVARSKEKYLGYYLECLLDYILEGEIDEADSTTSNISRFLNQRDSNGNTALHLFAYNMNRKCIKILIRHHKLLDLGLRNSVNYSIEDYLASHNLVLKIEDVVDEANASSSALKSTDDEPLSAFKASRGFDLQLHKTRMAINSQSSTASFVTEKLSEAAYAIDRELGEKDEKLLILYKCLHRVSYIKFTSQKAALKKFNLDYLIDDMEAEFSVVDSEHQNVEGDVLMIDTSRDSIIQDEISRLINDLSFQALIARESYSLAINDLKATREKSLRMRLLNVSDQALPKIDEDGSQRLRLAILSQQEILRRRGLADRVYNLEGITPVFDFDQEEFKENSVREDPEPGSNTSSSRLQLISNLSPEDRLYKYCKLIASSCGMSLPEVEQSIDQIEQSLARSKR